MPGPWEDFPVAEADAAVAVSRLSVGVPSWRCAMSAARGPSETLRVAGAEEAADVMAVSRLSVGQASRCYGVSVECQWRQALQKTSRYLELKTLLARLQRAGSQLAELRGNAKCYSNGSGLLRGTSRKLVRKNLQKGLL
ncbi:unnamed protein product [Polarella glacialis]|uniref:Uncharacterized protein n=1 Tax=Polarella glacialis TaxID=89957 RepID=A0A813FFN2_POLGL|nr:unnamed protein product [Polarella glacialis]